MKIKEKITKIKSTIVDVFEDRLRISRIGASPIILDPYDGKKLDEEQKAAREKGKRISLL